MEENEFDKYMNDNLEFLSNKELLKELKKRGVIDCFDEKETIDYVLNDLYKKRKTFDNFFDELFWQMNDEQKNIIIEILKKRNVI